MSYRHLIVAFTISLAFTTSVSAKPKTINHAAYALRLKEADKHPNGEYRKLVKAHGQIIAAVKLIKDLSSEENASLRVIMSKIAEDQKIYDGEHTEALKIARAGIAKYRHTPGPNHEALYHQHHKQKNKIAQGRPKAKAEQIRAALSSLHQKSFDENLARIHFWYGGHGEHIKDIRLIQAGASIDRAIELRKQWYKASKQHKSNVRQGINSEAPSFESYLQMVKSASQTK